MNDLIARLDLDDPSSVRRAEPFHGSFPKLGPPTAISGKVHQKFAASVNSAHMILAGYEHNINEVRHIIIFNFKLISIFNSPFIIFIYEEPNFMVYGTQYYR